MGLELFLPFITIGILWAIIGFSAWFSYYSWGVPYEWPYIYEYNKRFGNNYKYIIRFQFGDPKKDYDIKTTKLSLFLFGPKDLKISNFVITPRIIEKAVPNPLNAFQVSKFFFLRNQPFSNIVKVMINHSGVGSLFVSTIEIQGMDSEKANIAYVNEYIACLPLDEAKVRQTFPAGTQEFRAIELSALTSKLLSFKEYLGLIWLALNLIPMFCLFLVLCTTYIDPQTQLTSNETVLHLCTDYHDTLFSSTSSALCSSTVSAIIFIVVILIYRFVIKHGLANNWDNWVNVKTAYFYVMVTLGVVCGVFAAFDALKSAESALDSWVYLIYWDLALFFGIIFFLMIWLPLLSIIGYFIGFYHEVKDPNTRVPKDMILVTNDKNKNNSTGDQLKQRESYQKLMTSQNLKVKSISQYSGVKKTQSEVTPKASQKPGDKTIQSKISSTASKKPDDKKPKKSSSQESIGEGYYQQLMKGQKKVKSVSQY